MSRLLSVEDDVENRVRSRLPGEHAPQLVRGNVERMRRLASSVEDAGHEPARPQTPRVGGAAPLALLHLEFHALTGHLGGSV